MRLLFECLDTSLDGVYIGSRMSIKQTVMDWSWWQRLIKFLVLRDSHDVVPIAPNLRVIGLHLDRSFQLIFKDPSKYSLLEMKSESRRSTSFIKLLFFPLQKGD